MRPQHTEALRAAQGPFVSVYIDDSRDSAEADGRIEAVWRRLRGDLADSGVGVVAIAAMEEAILRGTPGAGPQGRGLIATPDGVLVDEHLPAVPRKTVLRVSEYPYVLPLIGVGRPPYLFAAVDHEGATITVHHGETVRTETVDGGGFPVHKPVSAGWNGYGDLQHSTEEAVRMNVRAAAHRITELVDGIGAEVVFVCGEVRSRTDVAAALPSRVVPLVAELPAGAHGHRADEEELGDQIDAVFTGRRRSQLAETMDRLRGEAARESGLAAQGLAAVCGALRQGDVDTLIIGELGDAVVVTGESRTMVAPDADVLSEFGEAPCRVVRADEALPFAAIAVGATLVSAEDGVSAADGIAALLRYAPACP